MCRHRLYFQSGGQPGRRAARHDPQADEDSNGFFLDTLRTLDEAYLRPRYDGYRPFQETAGVVHRHLRDAGEPRAVLGRAMSSIRDLNEARLPGGAVQ